MLVNKKINPLSILFILLVIGFLISIFARNEQYAYIDAKFFHAYGMTLLAGKSPYSVDDIKESLKIIMQKEGISEEVINKKFAKSITFGSTYPPSLAVYVIPPALFDWNISKYYYDITNIIALLAIIAFLMFWINHLPHIQVDFNKLVIVMCFGGLMHAVSVTMTIGQISLIPLAGCCGALYFSERKKFFVASLFIILASIKPHMSLPLVIYLLIRQKSWHLLIWPSLLLAVIFSSVLIMGGDLNPLPEIISNYKGYTAAYVNLPNRAPGLTYLLGHFFGINRTVFILSGLVTVIILAFWFEKNLAISDNNSNIPEIWAKYREEQSVLIIAFIFTITTLFMPLRGYDHVAFLPVFALLAVIRWRLAIWLLPGLILIARPGHIATALNQIIEIGFSSVPLSSLGIIYLTLVIMFIMWKLRQEVAQIH